MDSLKPFDIRLNDIWIECQKELIEMRDKIIELKSCLRTSDQINKHLIKCNEILVAIIEKCKIDEHNNKGMNVLIKTIKKEEECIEAEKENLNKIKTQIKCEFNEQKVFDLISNWNTNKTINKCIENKSTQTSSDENSFVFMSENLNTLSNTDLNELKDSESSERPNDQNDSINSIGIDFNVFEDDNKSDISVKSDDFLINNNESNESELEFKELDLKEKRKRKKKVKNTLRTQKMNSVVMPYKIDDSYVCTEDDCSYATRTKRLFFRHINRHMRGEKCNNEKGINTQKSDNTQPMSEKILKMFEKVKSFKEEKSHTFICNEENCTFNCKSVQKFYSHFRQHNPNRKKRSNFHEIKSNDSDRPYVCDWPACAMTFKRPQHLTQHRKRHLGEKDYVCDWPGCGVKMYTSHNYTTHRLIHTNERPWKCEWPGCSYASKQKWALVAHRRTHTGEKPYVCPFPECGYRCSQPCTLLSHKRKHTGEKPYACPHVGCGKRFSALAGIWTHKKIHSRKETEDFSQKNPKTAQKKTKNKDKTEETESDDNECESTPRKRKPRKKKTDLTEPDINESSNLPSDELIPKQ